MEKLDISSVVRRQSELAGPIERAITNLKKCGEANLTRRRVQGRLDALRQNWKNYKDAHLQIVCYRDTHADKNTRTFLDDHDYFTKSEYFATEELFLEAQEFMEERLDQLIADDPMSGDAMADRSAIAQEGVSHLTSHLPKLELKKFNGDPRDWLSFRDLFHALVGSNTRLTNVEKLQYLKSCLTDAAEKRVESIDITNDNFATAWDYLTNVYDDRRLIVKTAMRDFLDAKPVTRSSGAELDRFVGDVTRAITALETLGQYTSACDAFVVHIVVSKLDANTVRDWEASLGSNQLLPTWVKLLRFLETRVRSTIAYEMSRPSTAQQTSKSQRSARTNHASVAAAPNSTKQAASTEQLAVTRSRNCAFCSGAHFIAFCPKFRSKALIARKAIVVEKQLCFNCLGQHRLAACTSAKRCQQCNEQHHTLIHDAPARGAGNASPPTASNRATGQSSALIAGQNRSTDQTMYDAGSSAASHHVVSRSISRKEVLLTTASIRVRSHTGHVARARALLDTGSELSFISESLAQHLKLPRQRIDVPIVGIGGRSNGTTRGAVSFTIQPHFTSSYRCQVDAVTLPKLTSDLAKRHVLTNEWPHLRDLQLADPEYAASGCIDVILGADVHGQLLKSGIKRGPKDAPIAQHTELGWVLSGPCSSPKSADSLESTIVQSTPFHGLHCSIDRAAIDTGLHELLQRFWVQEEPSSSAETLLTPEEEECEAHFLSTHSRDSTGRYTVRLPFKVSPSCLGDSRGCAARMLSRLQRRFTSEPILKQLYADFLQQYEELGHMEVASAEDSSRSSGYFLPHHGVLKESSSTTKLRVVFNGSARSSSGHSINDLLHIGAKLQSNLADVILRWRKHQFVFSADIEKMFRQIRIHRDDWNYQRILWSSSSTRPATTYNLTTVTYGLGPAPFLSIRVLKQLVNDEGHRFPLASDIISRGTYVDDMFGGADTLLEAQQAVQQLDNLCMAGGFTLQKWYGNYSLIVDAIPLERHGLTPTVTFEEDSLLLKTLGISWRPTTDSFEFSAAATTHQAPYTKRKVLSRISQVFDPLGWLSPVTIRAKILMQDLWLSQTGWDEPITDVLLRRWEEYLQQIETLPQISIPRWLGTSASALAVEIHGFADASEHAMASIVYLRVLRGLDDAHVALMSAKTKVAPLKKMTIPRLELTAATLLARQVASLRTALDLENAPVHLWTDSTVALTWIQGPMSRWKDYVRNRVSAIHEVVPTARWHHVPGVDNPADCASRGLTPQQLKNHPLWWKGPEWLAHESTSWPATTPTTSLTDITLEERRKIVVTARASTPTTWDLLDRYSSLTRLLRITATCRRLFTRRSPTMHSLTPTELDSETKFWVKIVQHEYFGTEIKTLVDGRALPSSNPLLRLVPFVEKATGILRLGGRLRNSLLDPDAKHPSILPRESKLSTLLIADAHEKTLHGGTQSTLSYLRRSYWILGGRTPVRSYILRCVRCARQRGLAAQQLMGQLPVTRATPSRPFLHTGVDYAGPFTIKSWRGRNTKTYKGYIVLFVCFSTSALHLEAVTDYSTAGFLSAFRRFTGRRGICATLNSDCGTNLVGADKELRTMFSQRSVELKSLASLLANDGTEWRFNPPSAPHFGGKWEAGVKSVKFHLRRAIGDHLLTYEELSTLLVQIEAVLNSRPLCPLSDDPADVNALTPGHFLVGSALSLVPEPTLTDLPISRLSRWQLVTQMLEHFWSRWSTEYLQKLQGISKWHRPTNVIDQGSLVLIIDERYPPSKWPLARVLETHPGSDGLTRVVTVKTQTSKFKRPITKLCILPIEPTGHDAQKVIDIGHQGQDDIARPSTSSA